MRGVVVKRIARAAREAAKDQPTKPMGKVHRWYRDAKGDMQPGFVQVVNTGFRSEYQKLKKAQL